MNFDDLVGKKFQEQELYELLVFDIEENFEGYCGKAMHLYFERVAGKKIRITSIVNFQDADEMDLKSRSIIEKIEWFNIYENCGHIDLMLVRFDRTGHISIVSRNNTHHQDTVLGWADETLSNPPTEDQLRQAFRDLSGYLERHSEVEKLRFKKAV